MDPSQKISVLLAEYNTLRAEVLAARSNVAQAISLTVPVLMGLIGLSYSTNFAIPSRVLWTVTGVAIIYLVINFAWNDWNTRKFTARLRSIERHINALALEPLLTWETTQGWGAIATRTNLPSQSN